MSWKSTHSKTQAQRMHAKKRAFERYGLELNRHDLRDMVKSIQNRGHSATLAPTDGLPPATFLFKESGRVSHYVMVLRGIRVVVVYDRLRKTIVTFLPPEAEHQYGTQHE